MLPLHAIDLLLAPASTPFTFPRSEITNPGFHQLTEYLELRGYTTLLAWWGPEDWEQHLVKLAIEASASRVITSVSVSEETHGALRTAGVKTISSLLATQEELAIPLQLAARNRGLPGSSELGLCWNSVQESSTGEEYFVNIEEALTLYPETSALVTYNDHVALGTLSALQALETPVLERVSLIGVGNLPLTEATSAPLTTVNYSYLTEAVTSEAIDVAVVERESVASPCGSALPVGTRTTSVQTSVRYCPYVTTSSSKSSRCCQRGRGLYGNG